ncbi:MAG: LysR family transcriptional regulator [Pseudomonadota bacterium]
MDTKGLRLFVLAAEKSNISGAGKALGFGPAVSSAKLAKLERELDSELLHRSTRKVSLSVEGEEFLPFAREIIAQENAALDALGHRQSEPKGMIRFASSSTFAQLHVVPLLPKFMETFPLIGLDLRLSDSQADLIEGSFDLALRNQNLADSTLKARKLADDERVLCASPEYLARQGKPTSIADLKAHQLIGFQGSAPRKLVSPEGEVQWFDPGKSERAFMVDDGLSQKLATVAGAGLSVNSLWSVHEELKSGALIRLFNEYRIDDDVAIWLVYPRTNVLSAKVRALIDFLVTEIGEQPEWSLP